MAAEPFLGGMYMFASNFAPTGYAMCSGQVLAISNNTALFSLLGTTYGGNGISTFALPDMRGRSPIAQGQGPGLSPFVLGQQGGTENVTVAITNMPSHTHTATASATASQIAGGTANATSPAGNYAGVTAAGTRPQVYASTASSSTMAAAMVSSLTVTNATTGGGQPISIRNPSLAINFIIALQGIFPSRN